MDRPESSQLGFAGMASEGRILPANPSGAIGRDVIVTAVNVRVAIFDRAGRTLLSPRPLGGLDPSLVGASEVSDPRVVYDQSAGIFVLAFMRFSTSRSVLEVVTVPESTAQNVTSWCVTRIEGDETPADGPQIADFPGLGFDDSRVTLTTNNYDVTAAGPTEFAYTEVLSIRKEDLYRCAPSPVPIDVFAGTSTENPDGTPAFSIEPAVSVGRSAA